MIVEAPAGVVKLLMPVVQGVQEPRETRNIYVAHNFKLSQPVVPQIRLIDVECLVRTECRKHATPEILRVHQEVVLKGSSRIIARTNHLDAEPLEDIPRRPIVHLKPLVRALPDRLRGLFVEQFVDVEVALKFQVSPMIEGVAQSVRNRACPGKEFFFGRS